MVAFYNTEDHELILNSFFNTEFLKKFSYKKTFYYFDLLIDHFWSLQNFFWRNPFRITRNLLYHKIYFHLQLINDNKKNIWKKKWELRENFSVSEGKYSSFVRKKKWRNNERTHWLNMIFLFPKKLNVFWYSGNSLRFHKWWMFDIILCLLTKGAMTQSMYFRFWSD